jgi:hypothetical protein
MFIPESVINRSRANQPKSRHIEGLGVEKTAFLLHGTELRKAGALASLD